MSQHTTANAIGYFELVKNNRNFRFLWFGQILSLLGDWFNLIASASLIAFLTQSELAIGGLFVVRMLAPFLVSPLAGVVADRYNRKYLLIITDVIRAVIMMGFLLVRTAEQVWILYVLTALQLGMSGFFFPARNAILSDLVNRQELGATNALSSATWSVMLALGAALGGLATGQFGAYPSFILDSLTFVGSAVLLMQIGYHHTVKDDLDELSVGVMFKEYIQGLRYLREHFAILATTLVKPSSALLISGGFQVVQVTIAEKIFVIGKGGGTGLGLMYAAVGVGTGLGPIFARVFTSDRYQPQRIAIAIGFGVSIIGLFLISTLASFGIILLGTFLRGFGVGVGWVFSTQLLLQTLPDRVRGRVFSTEFAMHTLANAVEAAAGGWILDLAAVKIPTMLQGMGLLLLIPGLLWLGWTLLTGQATAQAQEEPVIPNNLICA